MERDMVTRPDAAIENLTNYQGQADMHGETVIVSRQALDETLAYIEAVKAARHREEAQAELVEALESIAEYWNRDRNDAAMHDACWHAIETAETALAAFKGEQP